MKNMFKALVFSLVVASTLTAKFVNSGSMCVGQTLSIGMPDIINTGLLKAKIGYFEGLETMLNSGDLSFEKLFVASDAIITFEKTKSITLATSSVKVLVVESGTDFSTIEFKAVKEGGLFGPVALECSKNDATLAIEQKEEGAVGLMIISLAKNCSMTLACAQEQQVFVSEQVKGQVQSDKVVGLTYFVQAPDIKTLLS